MNRSRENRRQRRLSISPYHNAKRKKWAQMEDPVEVETFVHRIRKLMKEKGTPPKFPSSDPQRGPKDGIRADDRDGGARSRGGFEGRERSSAEEIPRISSGDLSSHLVGRWMFMWTSSLGR